MSKKHKHSKSNPLDIQYADDLTSMDVVSPTEVTGMVPTPPLNEAQAEGYGSLLPVRQQPAENARKADSPEEQKRQSQKT